MMELVQLHHDIEFAMVMVHNYVKSPVLSFKLSKMRVKNEGEK